jgi:hypothetical protein
MNDELLEESDIIPVASIKDLDTKSVPADRLQEIKQLGDALSDLDRKILEQEATISTLKTNRKKIAEELIPDQMQQVGLQLIQLDDGTKIQLNDFVDARIKDPQTAFEWLRETNNDSIIKNQLSITLDRGQDALVTQIQNLVKDSFGVDTDAKVSVHHATLKAFCRDALDDPELAESLPREAFGIYQGTRAKITQ